MTEFKPKSDFLRILQERGFHYQTSNPEEFDALANAGKAVGYIGFDCTAKSFHIGNLVQIMQLAWLQRSGNKPIALMGGGTTRVGDPSGKDEMRKLLSLEDIEINKERLKRTFAKLLTFGDGPLDAIMVDNAEWLVPLNYIEFLRDVGRHFSVSRMLSMDSVKGRLDREQEFSFIEFNYMLLQAYDYVELARRYGCNLQLGGSDQWGNIVTGIDLGRRMGTHQLFAQTSPLITTSSGAKMGKSAAGAVWLEPDMLSAYDYWQYWRNAEDADVARFLKIFTFMPMDEIKRLGALQGTDINQAKIVLATEATSIIHGRAAADTAAETARKTFEEGTLAIDLPTVEVSNAEISAGLGLLSAFVKAGIVPSTGEARRQIKSGGLKLNDDNVTDERANLLPGDFNSDGIAKLSMGKKKHVLLKMV